MYCYTPGGKECAVAQWTDEGNYVFLWLSSIAYAYRVSHDPFFAKWAEPRPHGTVFAMSNRFGAVLLADAFRALGVTRRPKQ